MKPFHLFLQFFFFFSLLFSLFGLHADWFLEAKGYNYGFVEYDDPGAAERAMQTLNGRRVHQSVRCHDMLEDKISVLICAV